MVRIHLFILTFLLSTGAAATPMLTTDGSGNVTGATGLEADGATYSMEFVDGTCPELFDGCDANADFIVPGTDDVTHASLLPTFFDAFIAPVVTADDGSLDALPSKAFGCDDSFCTTFAPSHEDDFIFGVTFGLILFNWAPPDDSSDGTGSSLVDIHDPDSTNDPGFNYARFSLQPASVPTPGTLPLVALGLLVLGLRRKGKTA